MFVWFYDISGHLDFGHLQDIRATEPRRVTGYLSHEAWVAHLLMAIRIWGELV